MGVFYLRRCNYHNLDTGSNYNYSVFNITAHSSGHWFTYTSTNPVTANNAALYSIA